MENGKSGGIKGKGMVRKEKGMKKKGRLKMGGGNLP